MNSHDDSNIKELTRKNSAFALSLYKKLKEAGGNLFFSPYSISTAFAMTYAGARANTETEIAQTLHFSLDQEHLHPAFASLETRLNAIQKKENVALSVANSLWPQEDYDFLEEFLTLIKTYYGVSITPLNYRDAETAREKINRWVEEKTEEKIKQLIPKGVLTPMTRLVLTNAIYFKGSWADQFNKALTKNAPFWTTPDETVEVSMMAREQKFGYAETDDLQILELPYAGNDLSLIMLLPREIDGLVKLEDMLTEENLTKWTSRLPQRNVWVSLPRFKVNSQFRLDSTLKSMGIIDPFDDDKADFSAMDGVVGRLSISAIFHQAFIDVNEAGSEAAAATAVVIVLKSFSIFDPPATFRADHPFIFLIRENLTGSILFLGRMINPDN